ncbi:hypothetical protein AY599_16125 [Leptolyngbya valderiana BDU 20041]|nr:hypothetical protein AY599_16125 [Leptolyngbya valderiana BDU 20041]
MDHAHRTRRGGTLKKLLLALATILVVLAVIVGWEVFLAVTSTPAITENYSQCVHDRTLDRQRSLVGDGANQWPAFEAHMTELAKAHAWYKSFADSQPQELVVSPYGELTFEHIYEPAHLPGSASTYALAQERAVEALDQWREMGVFDRTADLATLDRVAIPPVDHAVLDTLLPYLGLSRRIAHAQAARMHLAAREGRPDERLAALDQTLTLGRQTAGQGPLICWLVGVVIHELALERLLEDQLLYPAPDEAWLVQAEALIERETLERFPSAGETIADERVAWADTVQRVFTSSGRFIPVEFQNLVVRTSDDPLPYVTPFGDSPLSNVTARVWQDRTAADARLDQIYERTGEAMDAIGAPAVAADRRLAQARRNRPWNSLVADVLMVDGPKMVRVERTRRIRTAGARVVLAIERYRLRHGAIPPSIDALGDLLPEHLRTDPFTEQPWDYQPSPTTTTADGEPLGPGATPWPYTLRSRPLPSAPARAAPLDPMHGILITVPREASNFDD